MSQKPTSIATLGAQARLELLVDAVVDYAIYLIDRDGTVATWNTGAERIKGYTAAEIVGRHYSLFHTPEDRAAGQPARALETAAREGRYEHEGWRVRKDGTRFWASVVIDAVYGKDAALIGFAKVTRDLTERRRIEQDLRASEQRLRLLVQSVHDYAIYMLDHEGHVTNWNSGAERIKGYTAAEIVGRHFSQFYTEEDRLAGEPTRALRTAAEFGRYANEAWRLRKDGTRFWASVVLEPIYDEARKLIGFAKVTRDITERKQAQEELEEARAAMMQSQKMEAIGQLTAGIAHDFNNLLMVISSSYDVLNRTSGLDTARRDRIIETARRATERGAKLTQQLLAFGRRQPLRPQTHDLNQVIRNFEPMLRRALGESVEMELSLSPSPVGARVDSQQFEVALLNLVVNARAAMPGGGRLTIASAGRSLGGRTARALQLVPGEYAAISVADTGSGMPPEIQAKAFEPFFTTGQGSGLGLSQVYGFVTQSGGGVDLQSTPGQGTQVNLFLPRAALLERQGQPEEAPPEPAPPDQGERTVLIVEDNPDVLEMTVELVGSMGFSVLTAPDALSALDILQKGGPIDLLFTDVVMPKGMNGVELARQARRLMPELAVLLASGYPASALSDEHGLTEDFAFIGKPYRWTELADKLKGLGVGGV